MSAFLSGAVWYQGEANSAEPAVYKVELPALIRDWRSHWGQGDFPFLIVQLPNFMQRRPDPTESSWADMREVQYQTAASLPKTGVAITIDIGDAGVIHPADKLDVGHRLGLLAQHIAYGQANVFTGPTFKSSSIDGNHIRILFDNIGSGLTIGMAPTHFYECQRPPLTPPAPGAELEGFAVAGADQKFVWANRPRRR
jgi:sialate O-acetylesterase